MKNFTRFRPGEDKSMWLYAQDWEEGTFPETEMIAYARMAKQFMNKPFTNPLDIVGNYEWHENLPYTGLLTNGIPVMASWNIVDFGCGPGRMIQHFRSLSANVDGIDISEFALNYARQKYIGSNFYVSSGIDVGDAPEDHYDLIYSTICMQHIPSRTIRRNVFRGMFNLLKPGGYISIQMGYHPTYGAGLWSPDTEHATYDSDYWSARGTNGHADCVINAESLPLLKKDLEEIFGGVTFWHHNVRELYANNRGAFHAPYWCDDWLFIKARKA